MKTRARVNKVKLFLFSVCYMECVRCILISRKRLFSTNCKKLSFMKIRLFATFKLALFEQIVKLRSTLKNGYVADRHFNMKRQSYKS